MAALRIFTIGYATHSVEEFIELLEAHGITAVADVRSQPYSRVPTFCQEAIQAALGHRGIHYVFLGTELGARRNEDECYVNGQATYDRIAGLPCFRKGLDRLRDGAQRYTIALMCAEADPLDCHRAVLVCRHLRAMGFDIQHILADGSLEPHEALEKRLVTVTNNAANLYDSDMPESDRIQRAYDAQGMEIAYRQSQEGGVR